MSARRLVQALDALLGTHVEDDALARGRRAGCADAVRFLRAQADVHRGRPADRHRRSALHVAAELLESGRQAGRP